MKVYDAILALTTWRDTTKSSQNREIYNMAISALCAQLEENKSAREGFIRCGYVSFSEKFGRFLMPYRGCPRGAIGPIGFTDGETGIEMVLCYLRESRDNILVGPDEDYVCIPKLHIKYCMDILRDIQNKAEKKGAVTDGEDKG